MSTIISFSKISPKLFYLLCALVLFLQIPGRSAPAAERGSRAVAARRAMVERDLRARGIKDQRELAVMEEVPRHLFGPADLRDSAYADRPLPIGAGQTISQPYIVAFMSELLMLKATDTVLEIGTGSGYQTAVLRGSQLP